MKITQSIILAGGLGTRLKPLTQLLPKPMVNIAGRPLLSYHIDGFIKHGIKNILVKTFYKSTVIEKFIKDYENELNDICIDCIVEKSKTMGTAGFLSGCLHILDDLFLVVCADNLTDINYTDLFAYFSNKYFDVAMVLYKPKDMTQKGMVVVDSEGYVQSFTEKPEKNDVVSEVANAGIYLIKKDVVEKLIPHDQLFDFSYDLFPSMLSANMKILTYTITNEFFVDIGTVSDYISADNYVQSHADCFS